MNKYISSEKFSPICFFYLFLSVFTIFPLLGLIYSYLIFYIPLIYLNFLISIGAGYVLGEISGYIIKISKVRNSILGGIIGFLGTLSFFYFSWVVWVDLVININNFIGTQDLGISVSITKTIDLINLILNPGIFLNIIIEINKVGTWGIKDLQFSGWLLSIVWLLETLILFYLSIFKATEVSKEPFSEKNNSWYKFSIYNFNEIDTNVILDNISNNNFNFVSDLTKINNLDKNYLEFILYFSNNDDYLLGVNKKTLKLDEKGKKSFKTDEIIKNFYIDFGNANKIENLK